MMSPIFGMKKKNIRNHQLDNKSSKPPGPPVLAEWNRGMHIPFHALCILMAGLHTAYLTLVVRKYSHSNSENNAAFTQFWRTNVHNINDVVQLNFSLSEEKICLGVHAGETSKCCSPLNMHKVFGLRKKAPLFPAINSAQENKTNLWSLNSNQHLLPWKTNMSPGKIVLGRRSLHFEMASFYRGYVSFRGA